MTEKELKVKLMELPPDFEGILFVEHGTMEVRDVERLQTKAKVMVVFCYSPESIRLVKIPWRTPNKQGKEMG